jgi:3-oxoadipate enol-lactonase
MPKVQVGDIQIYYNERGSGTPLLMIQGLNANSDWWGEEALNALAREYRVVVFDNRGAGRTDRPASPYSIPMFAADAVGLLDALGIEQAHVLGYSMGGMIAQELALRNPERVKKLILVATNCGGRQQVPASPEVLASLTPKATEEERKKDLIYLLFPDDFTRSNPDRVEEFWKRVIIAPIDDASMMRQVAAIIEWGCYDRLPELRKPTLVMHGTADILVPPANGRILAERIPGARLIEYEGGGHGFLFQFPDQGIADILSFLKE